MVCAEQGGGRDRAGKGQGEAHSLSSVTCLIGHVATGPFFFSFP